MSPSATWALAVALLLVALGTPGCHRGRHVVGRLGDAAVTVDSAPAGGNCGTACPAGEACLSGTCTASCPAPLQPCAGACVDIGSDSSHCGGCGKLCPAGEGCVGGSCLRAVPLGAPPPRCQGLGPPIVFAPAAGGGCAGQIAAATFVNALCSCGEVGVPQLSSEAGFDAFDSTKAPYRPGGLGGGLAANGTINATSRLTVTGDLRSAAQAGLRVVADVTIEQNLYLAGGLRLENRLQVGGDAHVNGTISGGASSMIGGTLHTPSCASVPATLQRGNCADSSVAVTDPCPCPADASAAIFSRITHYADPANNDNATIALPADVFDQPGAPARLDLPCGFYYLNQIHAAGPTTIAVHGNTALFIGGSIQASAPLVFALDAGATMDVHVAGTVLATADLSVGTPADPSRSRFYIGGRCQPAAAVCRLDADCCSGSCANGICASTGETRTVAVRASSGVRLNGLLYAPERRLSRQFQPEDVWQPVRGLVPQRIVRRSSL